jgi:hypothetical protein
MKSLSNETTYKKSNDIIRLYRPPTSNEMATEGKYLSLPNDCFSEIMRHLGYYYLHPIILVNKSLCRLLTRPLENGPSIFAYCNDDMIDPELLKRLYEEDEALLNQHKAKCHRGHIPLCSMIMCSTEWPGIDPRKLHLLSLVDPRTCDTLTLRTFWCGNINCFSYTSLDDENRFYGELSWRKPASEDEFEPLNELSNMFTSFLKFSLEEHGYLEIKVTQLLESKMRIEVLPEFNILSKSLCSTNTLGIPENEFSVILTIDQCKNLTDL